MTSDKCTFCGSPRSISELFCRTCGASLPDADAGRAAPYGVVSAVDYSQPPAYGGPAVPGQFGRSGTSAGIWRRKSTLIVHKRANFPEFCIKCNAPTNGSSLYRKLSWHHPAFYLLIFVGLLFYVVAALIFRKTAELTLGLCEEHLAKRRRAILIAWLTFGLGVLAIVLGVAGDSGKLALIGVLTIFAAAVYGAIAPKVVTVSKIEDEYVWLKRVHPDYLERFPSC